MEKLLNSMSVVLALVLLVVGCQPTTNRVSLANDSSFTIQKATIQVSGRTFTFENVPSSESREFSFNVGGDSAYSVRIVFVGGAELNKNQLGYVTSGVNSHDVIHVNNAEITLENIGQEFH